MLVMADAIHRAPTYCTAKLMAATPLLYFYSSHPFTTIAGEMDIFAICL